MRVLVTGGCGYIGSHTVLALVESGYDVVVVDNLANSSRDVISRLEAYLGQQVPFRLVDMMEKEALIEVFHEFSFDAVIHLAGLKSVSESVSKPIDYYQTNITTTLHLIDCMKQHQVFKLIFSSSATVYGNPDHLPLTEHSRLKPENPYGRTKLFIEEMLKDVVRSTKDPLWNVISLRYFNPVSAHHSGIIGEDPKGTPANLLPFVSQVAAGLRPYVTVYGGDYPTRDGTGVRDYIHIEDLAEGHLAALRKLDGSPGYAAYNLGTGVGYSVLEMIKAMSRASGHQITYKLVDRRDGDVATVYADSSEANRELNWKAKRNLEQMCRDLWNYQQKQRQIEIH